MPPVLSPTLVRSNDGIKSMFRELKTTADVAALLEVSEDQLTYAIWRMPVATRYKTWSIPKRNGGTRKIDAPSRTHKLLQRKLAHVLELIAQRRSAAHGFVKERSIVTNAVRHVRSRWVLNIDLKDFFPSIHFGRVRGLLIAKPYLLGERAATAIAQLCCHNKVLPQGAPTSPIVSNMICARLDGELRRLAESHKCRYTRYVDDITFSTNRERFPIELATPTGDDDGVIIAPMLCQLIESNGFQINLEKVRILSRTVRQEVTGLIVNRRPNVRRAFVSQIRAMLHAWEKHGYDLAQEEYLKRYDSKFRPNGFSDRLFERVVKGKLAFLKHVRGPNDSRYLMLRQWLGILLGEVHVEIKKSEVMEYDVFICHASEDKKNVVEPLSKAFKDAGIRVWVDSENIGWGEGIVESVNSGLSHSRFAVIVLSESFLKKNWPAKEMNAVLSKEIKSGITCVLALLVGEQAVTDKILTAYPLLADKRYVEWSSSDVGTVVSALKSKLTKDN